MKPSKSFVITIAVSVATIVAGPGLHRQGTQSGEPADGNAPTIEELYEVFMHSRDAQIERATWMRATVESLRDAGMEPGTAGFHLLRPEDDPAWSSSESNLYQVNSRFAFWDVERADPSRSYAALAGPGGVPYAGTPATITRFIQNEMVNNVSIVPDVAPQRYCVQIQFSEDALSTLARLLGTTRSEPFADWYGTWRAASQPPSTMAIVLVSQNKAYIPLIVNDIVAQGLSNYPITVASDLDDVTAQRIVSGLGQ